MTKTPPLIDIVLADDHQMVRQSLAAILAHDKTLEIKGEASDGEQALELLKLHQPKVAVIDISMPRLDGIALAAEVKRLGLPVKVLILTMHSEAKVLMRAVQAGALGIVLKEDALTELSLAIRQVSNGEKYISPSLQGAFDNVEEPMALSTREAQVLKLVVEGESSKEIAEKLGVSVKTVDTYRSRAAQKLGVRTGPEMVREAIRQRLV